MDLTGKMYINGPYRVIQCRRCIMLEIHVPTLFHGYIFCFHVQVNMPASSNIKPIIVLWVGLEDSKEARDKHGTHTGLYKRSLVHPSI